MMKGINYGLVLKASQLADKAFRKWLKAQEKELIRLAIADATRRANYSAEAMGLKPNRVQLKNLVFEGADAVASNRVLMRATAKADYATMPTPTIESGTTTLTLSVKANALVR